MIRASDNEFGVINNVVGIAVNRMRDELLISIRWKWSMEEFRIFVLIFDM